MLAAEITEAAYPVYQLAPLHVSKTGWYRISIPKYAAAITLNDPSIGSFLQVSVSPQAPVLVKLPKGRFQVSATGEFSSLSHIERLDIHRLLRHFGAKALNHVKDQKSFSGLLRKIIHALDPRRAGFGSAAPILAETNLDLRVPLGPLARFQYERQHAATVRTGTVPQNLRIFVDTDDAQAANLHTQTYRNYTCLACERIHCDLVIRLGSGVRLFPEALEDLTRPFAQSERTAVSYSDFFTKDSRSFCFLPDCILNAKAHTLSEIVMVRREVDEKGGDIRELAPDQFYRISRPLAFIDQSSGALTDRPCLSDPPPFTDATITCIIPTRDRPELLAQIAYDLLDNTTQMFELIIVDNGSVQNETFALLEILRRRGATVVREDSEFNFSRLCNIGAKVAKGRLLAFINNDIRVLHKGWLANLARWAALPHVGAVGTRLVYPDHSLQHGGIALGLSGHAGHLFRHWPRKDFEKVPSLSRASLRSAVTGAVLMVEASKFKAVGGFDEAAFPVSFNDIDLCLRLRRQGLLCVYEPTGEAMHLEGASREDDTATRQSSRRKDEIRHFLNRWSSEIQNERWFSSALSAAHEDVKLL